jgi:hypothetical protein
VIAIDTFLGLQTCPPYYLVAIANSGKSFVSDANGSVFYPGPVLGGALTPSCWIASGGALYIFDFLAAKLYKWTPTTFTQISSYVAGLYCMMLDNYLITGNTDQPSDSPAIKFNRYNWSAPFAFGTWDASIDRTAGFNTLSTAGDSISAMFSMGNVGYILREQGMTQMTPTGDALAPFDITSLWDSTFGIGCSFPLSFAQYGSLAIWANNNNIYAFFSGNVPQAITGSAQAAIYNDINLHEGDPQYTTTLSGSITNTSDNSHIPELVYSLGILHRQEVAPSAISYHLWIYTIDAQAWTRIVVDLKSLFLSIINQPQNLVVNSFTVRAIPVGSISPSAGLGGSVTRAPKRVLSSFLMNGTVSGITYSCLASLYLAEPQSESPFNSSINLVYRQEEMRLGTKPTVRGVLVKLAGAGGPFNVSVNGTVFNGPNPNGTGLKTYKFDGVVTEENPQLSIQCDAFNGYVVKAQMDITYDEGDPQ